MGCPVHSVNEGDQPPPAESVRVISATRRSLGKLLAVLMPESEVRASLVMLLQESRSAARGRDASSSCSRQNRMLGTPSDREGGRVSTERRAPRPGTTCAAAIRPRTPRIARGRDRHALRRLARSRRLAVVS